ncbi:MAG: response regulator [Pseudomonadota bacterium]
MSTTEAATDASQLRVLLVDDQMIIVEAIRRMLGGEHDIEFAFVTDARQALATALDWRPTVILQDLVMPEIDGFGLIAAYRAEAALASVPVLVLSSKDDPKFKARSFELGANDYVQKLPERLELVARVRYHSGYELCRRQLAEARLALQGHTAALQALQ